MAKAVLDIRTLARAHTETAIKTLAGIMGQRSAPPSARVTAAEVLLERGWGRAVQPIAGDDGGPLAVVIRHIIEKAGENGTTIVDVTPRRIEPDSDPSQGDER